MENEDLADMVQQSLADAEEAERIFTKVVKMVEKTSPKDEKLLEELDLLVFYIDSVVSLLNSIEEE